MCCTAESWLSKQIVKSVSAGAESVVSAKPVAAAPAGATRSMPFFGHCAAGGADVGGAASGVGLGFATKTSVTSPRTPSRMFCVATSYQARKTRLPSGVTASDGYAPPSVPFVSTGSNVVPSALLARCTRLIATVEP